MLSLISYLLTLVIGFVLGYSYFTHQELVDRRMRYEFEKQYEFFKKLTKTNDNDK